MTEKLFTGTLNHNQNKNKKTSSSTPDMDPGVGCHGFIANPAGNIWSKYECFLKSGCQGMDFRETLMQKTRHFEDVLDFDL